MSAAAKKAIAVAASMSLFVCSAKADSAANGNDHSQTGSLAVGTGAETFDQYSTAVGLQANTQTGAHRSTAIGFRATIGEGAALSTALGFDANIGQNATNSVAVGTRAQIGAGAHHSVSIGNDSVIGEGSFGSTALGEAAWVGAGSTYSTAVGHGANVTDNVTFGTALGDNASVRADNGVALGYRARVEAANSVALGAGAVALRGAETNYIAYGLAAPQSSVGEVAVGTLTGNRTITGVAAGTDDYDAVNVKQLKAVDQFAVKYDELSPGVPDYTRITLGQGAIGDNPVLIRNVRAGSISSNSYDAVNGSQIHAISQSVASTFGGGSTVLQDGTISAPSYAVQGNVYNDVGSALSALDNAFDAGLARLSSKITREAGKAGAAGIAAASLRFDDRPGKLSVAIGGGTWDDYGAMAFGAGYTSFDQQILFNLSGVTTGDKWGVGGGLTFTLN